MNIKKEIQAPVKSTQSTLLVSERINRKFLEPQGIKGKGLTRYLHHLLADPLLEYKLSLLRPEKWKKHYQADGQDLAWLFFYPSEADWARLSIISNSSGFSRCYIFVYLMLLDIGILRIQEKRTNRTIFPYLILNYLHCSIILDERRKMLIRNLKT